MTSDPVRPLNPSSFGGNVVHQAIPEGRAARGTLSGDRCSPRERTLLDQLMDGGSPSTQQHQLLQECTPEQIAEVIQKFASWGILMECYPQTTQAILTLDLTPRQVEILAREDLHLGYAGRELLLGQRHLTPMGRARILRRHYLNGSPRQENILRTRLASPGELHLLGMLDVRWGRGNHEGFHRLLLQVQELTPPQQEIFLGIAEVTLEAWDHQRERYLQDLVEVARQV